MSVTQIDLLMNSYFERTPTIEWSYVGFLEAMKPYLNSVQGPQDKQKSVWRKRFLTLLTNILVDEEDQKTQNDNSKTRFETATYLVQQVSQLSTYLNLISESSSATSGRCRPSRSTGCRSLAHFTSFSTVAQPRAQHPPEATRFLENVDLDRQLVTKKDIFDKKSQIEAWDVLCISRSQKAGEYVNEVKSRIMNQAEMARDEEAGTSSGHKHTEGATIPAKKSALEDPKKENSKKRPAEEAPSIITPAPNLRGRSPPPSYKSGDNSFDAEASTPSPSNDHDVSDTGIHEDEDENPFITKNEEGSRNNKFKTILSWQHAINRIDINDASTNDWVADGYNISLDFREFQLTSINLLETNQTFSYAKDIDRILCLSSIMYCNEVKPEFVTCSEKVWNKIRPRPLVPKMLPSVVHLIIIEYNMFLNDKQLLDIKWHENWVKWSTLSTDEDKSIFDCAQEVTKNFFTYLSSVSFDEDKKLDEDTFVHRYCHRILEEIFSKDDFSLIWANGESESSKERRILDGNNHGRKPDFR
ncbi:8496_t:CDS:10, partial [Rhizophagus irregularis]